ncbi:CpsB/CapC family capsule biosynthesis tyrosine phosphatase [Bacillus sp. MUM 13]|uniref:tyrosine-protein phosphatase n=1 Tax=Bacillus sp. MUM 13 TaxID=1678001 RepID=UPI0008F5E514|nr:CpsB/CapC family capsule biosynthesis tyrosine phosphatase [Bacillus sp. MUM 13]OIK09833.1 tyrosine protein phosphatase [Bacillus sp. MUM 13]
MIDIHCHILPGIDDGAKTITDSLEMAKVAVQEGITSIIATPHHKNGSYDNKKKDILSKVRELNEVLKNSSVPLTILPGQETRIYGELLEDYEAGDILPLNISSAYLFIELPSGHVPRYTERLLYDVQNKGLTPIIVHPERNRELIQNPDILYQLVKRGALTQVTASSLAGYFGKNIKKLSHQLIEANLTHFISSDAHNTTNRSFKLMEALDEVEKHFGVDMVYFFQENAELLVQGQSVYKEIPEKITRKKFLGLF